MKGATDEKARSTFSIKAPLPVAVLALGKPATISSPLPAPVPFTPWAALSFSFLLLRCTKYKSKREPHLILTSSMFFTRTPGASSVLSYDNSTLLSPPSLFEVWRGGGDALPPQWENAPTRPTPPTHPHAPHPPHPPHHALSHTFSTHHAGVCGQAGAHPDRQDGLPARPNKSSSVMPPPTTTAMPRRALLHPPAASRGTTAYPPPLWCPRRRCCFVGGAGREQGLLPCS